MSTVDLVRLAVRTTLARLWAHPAGPRLGAALLCLIAGSTIIYRSAEDASWLESAYHSLASPITIGYLGTNPLSTAGRIITIVLILVGVLTLIAFSAEVARATLESREVLRDSRPRSDRD